MQFSQVGRSSSMVVKSNATGSFRNGDAGAAHFLRIVLELRHAVFDPQYAFLIVHVHASLELEAGNGCRVDVGNAPAGMFRENVSAATLAPFAIAARRLAVRANVIRTSSDADGIGLPEGERIHRRG